MNVDTINRLRRAHWPAASLDSSTMFAAGRDEEILGGGAADHEGKRTTMSDDHRGGEPLTPWQA